MRLIRELFLKYLENPLFFLIFAFWSQVKNLPDHFLSTPAGQALKPIIEMYQASVKASMGYVSPVVTPTPARATQAAPTTQVATPVKPAVEAAKPAPSPKSSKKHIIRSLQDRKPLLAIAVPQNLAPTFAQIKSLLSSTETDESQTLDEIQTWMTSLATNPQNPSPAKAGALITKLLERCVPNEAFHLLLVTRLLAVSSSFVKTIPNMYATKVPQLFWFASQLEFRMSKTLSRSCKVVIFFVLACDFFKFIFFALFALLSKQHLIFCYLLLSPMAQARIPSCCCPPTHGSKSHSSRQNHGTRHPLQSIRDLSSPASGSRLCNKRTSRPHNRANNQIFTFQEKCRPENDRRGSFDELLHVLAHRRRRRYDYASMCYL